MNLQNTDTSVTDDDFTDDIPEAPTRATETVTEPVATDTRHYPQRTRQLPDHLICQGTIWLTGLCIVETLLILLL